MAFKEDATDAGAGIGGFLGALLNPVIGGNKTYNERTTAQPSDAAGKTTMFVVIGLIVIAVVVTLTLLGGKKTPTPTT